MKYTYCLAVSLLFVAVGCTKSSSSSSSTEEQSSTSVRERVTEENVIEQLRNDPTIASLYQFPYEGIVEIDEELTGTHGFFVIIENHEVEYPSMGIAYFENISDENKFLDNIKDDYKLKFANLRAFMCVGCNNSLSQTLSLEENKDIALDVTWGPSIGRVSDEHRFTYDDNEKQWVWTVKNGSLDGCRSVDTKKYKIYLENFDIEENGFDSNVFVPNYSSSDFRRFAVELKKLVADSLSFTRTNPLLEVDVRNMAKGITLQNVQVANDCAYYLEQMYEHDHALILLEAILEKFPDRMVAYLNIGDIYRKREEEQKAKEAYSKYMEMMRERNLEDKIPLSVLQYVGV